jgi:glutathione-specific gamma-glutamylcyclotransferase
MNALDFNPFAQTASKMSLTAELVQQCEKFGPFAQFPSGFTPITTEERDALAEKLLDELGDSKLWVFAYGSLIWNPGFQPVASQLGEIYGWHRSFCLELPNWRGTPQLPGLMLALEHGGQCEGIAYQLPELTYKEYILQLLDREISAVDDTEMVRWVTVYTALGPIRALVFWAGPKGKGVNLKMPIELVARILAKACGIGGSSAQYLYETVLRLEGFGIRDDYLWKLQDLVAREIQSSWSGTDGVPKLSR